MRGMMDDSRPPLLTVCTSDFLINAGDLMCLLILSIAIMSLLADFVCTRFYANVMFLCVPGPLLPNEQGRPATGLWPPHPTPIKRKCWICIAQDMNSKWLCTVESRQKLVSRLGKWTETVCWGEFWENPCFLWKVILLKQRLFHWAAGLLVKISKHTTRRTWKQLSFSSRSHSWPNWSLTWPNWIPAWPNWCHSWQNQYPADQTGALPDQTGAPPDQTGAPPDQTGATPDQNSATPE